MLISILLSLLFAFFYVWWDCSLPHFERGLASVGATFVHLMQMGSLPLIIFSLIVGITSSKETDKLARIGSTTFLLYTFTTIFAVTLGLLLGFLLRPGVYLRKVLHGSASAQVGSTNALQTPEAAQTGQAWLPNNIFVLLSNNNNLVFIVVFSILFGVCVLHIGPKKQKVIRLFCKANNDIFTLMMHYIMQLAPFGLFAMVSSQLIHMVREQHVNVLEVVVGLVPYVLTVLGGLAILLFVLYPLMVSLFSPVGYVQFLRTMYPAMIFAFASASSTATLPKTSEQVGKLGVVAWVRNFVLSIGATVNMDGTAYTQGIIIAFATQLFGAQMGWSDRVYVVSFITISTIGVAGIPGASLVTTNMLLLNLVSRGVLQPQHVIQVIALILIFDKFLDMARTMANIMGDAAVSIVVHERIVNHMVGSESDSAGVRTQDLRVKSPSLYQTELQSPDPVSAH